MKSHEEKLKRSPQRKGAGSKKENVPGFNALVSVVANNVRRIRKKKGLTQEEVSSLAGFNYRFYQKIESGKYSPNLYTLFRLAKQLQVKLSTLLRS